MAQEQGTEVMREKVVIVGSGPAGWTAAIYAARANLEPVVFEGAGSRTMIPGGQLMFTTDVENYPGFPSAVTGPEMMMKFREQAVGFGTRVFTEDIETVDFSVFPRRLVSNTGKVIEADAVIIATGANARWLGVPGEERLARSGGGVSACAVCDGALPHFRGKPLAVIGGGDSAMEEATFLTRFADKVYIIHRSDKLRASAAMQERAKNDPKIEFLFHQRVAHIYGDEQVTGVGLVHTETGEETTLDLDGLFVAIGSDPRTHIVHDKLTLTDAGTIWVDGRTSHTSIEGVFAAGDVIDPTYRQAVTAAGSGTVAALDAQHYLEAQAA